MSSSGGLCSGAPPLLSLSFSGSGFLAVYQLGAAQCLLDVAPRLIRSAPKVFGASAGSLAAAAVVCGSSMERLRDEMVATAQESRKHLLGPLHPSFSLFKQLECCLLRSLPDNAHELAAGRLHISMTRLQDGQNILVSDFQSKDDLVQALLCSCFVPIYCGWLPPVFRGERYIDGGFTNIQPIQDSSQTLTVCPFAGEVDICPQDRTLNFYNLEFSGLNFQLTTRNLFRMLDALFPPACVALNTAYYRGYQDTIFFLQSNDLMENKPPWIPSDPCLSSLCSDTSMQHQTVLWEEERGQGEAESDTETPAGPEGSPDSAEERCDPVDDVSWDLSSLEQAFYHGLPAWIQGALLCNLVVQLGLAGFQNSFFPAHLLSYLLLPYTLPIFVVFSFGQKVLRWLENIPEEVFWLWQDVKQLSIVLTNVVVRSFQKNLAERIIPGLFPSPVLGVLMEPDIPSQSPSLRRRSVLRLQLSTSSSSFPEDTDSHSDGNPDPPAFTFLLNLQLELDSQPRAALTRTEEDFPLEFKESPEEVPSSPNITLLELEEVEAPQEAYSAMSFVPQQLECS
ncbi:patatin-like phospholipase domain-containing protein 2 [Amia ocellicauda]|uniref:patatin-like phospholipase domain-containing protein 2 n=1 Tax=Amia ocellicauda TaxID=2972642 RepID=UPI003463979B